MTDYDDPDGATEPGEDDDDLTEFQPEDIEEEIISEMERLLGVDDLNLLQFVGIDDVPQDYGLRGIHFDSKEGLVNYLLESPGMIPFTTLIQFGDDDYGIAVGGSE